ncbi:MAG: RraA family protein [Rhodospirillaceae bacterium]|nr:RraA family protein [Rhodospirillaceae bacterium]
MSVATHHIVADFKRPPAELIAKVARLHVGVSGFEAGPRQTMHPGIKPLDPTWRVCGPALTVRPEYWYDRMMGELAPKYAKPGDVIVVDAGGHIDVAVWGMSMTMSSKAAGVAGVVIDGATMNSALLARERVQMPIFARAVSATATTSEGPGSINVPIICGGVIVHPGDIILGDSDGVVVLKPEAAETIIRNVEAHNQGEQDPEQRKKPYWERRGVVEKLKAMKNVRWE